MESSAVLPQSHTHSNKILVAPQALNGAFLYQLCKKGNLESIQDLIRQDISVLHTRFKKNQTLLHIASKAGNSQIIEVLLQKGAEVSSQDINKQTPLHLACVWGHLKGAQFLLEKGAPLDLQDKRDRSPLHYACLAGHLKVVQYLIAKGAQVNLQDHRRGTALYLACEKGHFEVFQYLFELQNAHANSLLDPWGRSLLHHACLLGHLKVVQYLIAKGADVNLPDAQGETALSLASYIGHFTVVRYLLEKGANAAFSDVCQETPLHMAARKGNIKIVQCLVEEGCVALNVRNVNGETPLYLACSNNHSEVVEYLLKKGADPLIAAGLSRYTPLHIAVYKENIQVIWPFLQHRELTALLNNKNSNDNTPIDCIKLLVDDMAQKKRAPFNKQERKKIAIYALLLIASQEEGFAQKSDNHFEKALFQQKAHFETFFKNRQTTQEPNVMDKSLFSLRDCIAERSAYFRINFLLKLRALYILSFQKKMPRELIEKIMAFYLKDTLNKRKNYTAPFQNFILPFLLENIPSSQIEECAAGKLINRYERMLCDETAQVKAHLEYAQLDHTLFR